MEAKREAGRGGGVGGGIGGAEQELKLQRLIDDFLNVSETRPTGLRMVLSLAAVFA